MRPCTRYPCPSLRSYRLRLLKTHPACNRGFALFGSCRFIISGVSIHGRAGLRTHSSLRARARTTTTSTARIYYREKDQRVERPPVVHAFLSSSAPPNQCNVPLCARARGKTHAPEGKHAEGNTFWGKNTQRLGATRSVSITPVSGTAGPRSEILLRRLGRLVFRLVLVVRLVLRGLAVISGASRRRALAAALDEDVSLLSVSGPPR
jgi:hypothetical protein